MLNRLKEVGKRFRAKYRRIDGFQFYGQILDIPDTARVSNFLSARRYLRVAPECTIAPSNVVVIDGLKYIVAEHGTGFYVNPIYKHFKLFEVDTEAVWKKITSKKNIITGVIEKERSEQDDVVYLSLQPKTNIDDNIKVPQQTYISICDKEVSRNDIIDNKVVTKVDKVLGCWLIEMKEI